MYVQTQLQMKKMEPPTAICLHSARMAQDMAEVIAISLQPPFSSENERPKS